MCEVKDVLKEKPIDKKTKPDVKITTNEV